MNGIDQQQNHSWSTDPAEFWNRGLLAASVVHAVGLLLSSKRVGCQKSGLVSEQR
jgi:hypothetical protein